VTVENTNVSSTPKPRVPLASQDEMTFKLHRRPEAATYAEYEYAMLEYVTFKFGLYFIGCPASDLNRRFGHLGRKFDVRPLVVLESLVGSEQLKYVRYANHLIFFPLQAYYDYVGTDPEQADTIIDSLCEQSLKDVGIVFKDRRGRYSR